MPISVYSPSSLPSTAAPSSNFVGSVQLTQLLQSSQYPSRQHAAAVTFEPCATSSWHYHPLGQLIVGTLGLGLVTELGGQPRSIAPGDVVWISPDTVHWHGAQGSGSFSQLAITDGEDDYTTDWLQRATRSTPCVVEGSALYTEWLLLLVAVVTVLLILLLLVVRVWRRRKAQSSATAAASTTGGRQERLLTGAPSDAEMAAASPV